MNEPLKIQYVYVAHARYLYSHLRTSLHRLVTFFVRLELAEPAAAYHNIMMMLHHSQTHSGAML